MTNRCARSFIFPLLLVLTFCSRGWTADATVYELISPQLNASENVTVEAWIQIDAMPEPGARIVDKWGPGSQIGYRLELGADGIVQWVTTAPSVCQSAQKLPGGRLVQVVGVFSPRQTDVRLYIDGKLSASLPKRERGYERPRTDTPLRLGAGQEGEHRFAGRIERFAVFNRALTDEEVAQRFSDRTELDGLIGDWTLPATPERRVQPVAGAGALSLPLEISSPAQLPDEPHTLWYRRPAREWVEALPVGNGRLGGMVFGGVETERIQMNEDTIWQGAPYDPANPDALEGIRKARELVFAGKQKEAEEVVRAGGMGNPSRQASYQTLGNLMIRFPASDAPVSDYRRTLNIDSAVAVTTFERAGVRYTREVFASAPDQALVVRLSADRPGMISCEANIETPHRRSAVASRESDQIVLTGTNSDFQQIPGQVRFQSNLRAIPQGGSVASRDGTLEVSGADSVVFLVSCRTNFVNYSDLSADPAALADDDLAAAAKRSYAELRSRHVADYQSLYRRVSIDLGTSANAMLPTDERVKRFGDGNDTSLAALFYQYGRYLLISSSRPGDQPANLQGIWNDGLSAPWGGKYTININTEMNYWPAETTNLAECAEPLFQLVHDISRTGVNTARVMYGARGWVCHHNTDLWRATAPIDYPNTGMWPTGGAWLCTHLWEHYLFTNDKAFLEKSYPIFKGACEFFLDTLVEDPESKHLVTCPSISPESGGLVAGPAMDMQILRDLFQLTADASEILGIDSEFRREILATRRRLAPHRIGKYGQLQEWMQDRDREFDGNRHSSHLYALFPSAQITPADAELFAAAKKSLIGRGDGGTGWALAWKINMWARVLDGDHAYKLLTVQLTPPKGGSQGGGTYPNLFDAHPPFQIDGNFGGTSGMTEMLLQSHEGFLRLLPALPKAWPTGRITGLRARGGFEVDISWRDGKLQHATIRSINGNRCAIRYMDSARDFDTTAGATYELDGSLDPLNRESR